ncbi:MAG: hypothetical protein IRZ16_04310 [Myxococcaceae bacterium]|nr:hypothetical protein [Myxococcaceae bacterium]
MESLNYQPYLDKLIAFASSDDRKQDLLAARAEYFKLTGEVHEDDKSFEMRMASFFDWYLFDRPANGTGQTPAQEFFHRFAAQFSPQEAAAFRDFTETRHGLFEVRKIKKGQLRLRDLLTNKDYDVTERRTVAGLQKGDIIEARLIPHEGHLLFSSAFLFHPRESTRAILKEVKRRKKKEPERDLRELIWETSRMALKVDRYRQIAVEKIYDFEQKKL